ARPDAICLRWGDLGIQRVTQSNRQPQYRKGFGVPTRLTSRLGKWRLPLVLAQRIRCTDEVLLSTNYSRTFGKSFTRTNPSWLVNVSVWSALCAWATPNMRWLPVS